MNKQLPMTATFTGPASLPRLYISDMTFDKKVACWNDTRLLGALVRQPFIKV